MDLQIRTRHEIGQHAWDEFVTASDEAWLWHTFDLQDALTTWRSYSDLGFALVDKDLKGQIVAVVPLLGIDGIRVDSLGGIACRNQLGEKQRKKLIQTAGDTLVAIATEIKATEVNLMLSPMTPALTGTKCPRVNPLLELGCENTLSQTWVVDLSQTMEQIQARYSELTRRELKKTELEKYDIREATNCEKDLDAYYSLHCETYKRTGVAPHPKEYFQRIFEKFVTDGRARVLFLIKDGIIVAAQNTAMFKGGCLYWTGASHTEKSGGENRLLFDNQIKHAKQAGFSWYETGEAFPGATDGKNKGLNDFKKSFGGELYPYYKGRLVLTSNRAENQKLSLYQRCLDISPRMIGRISKRYYTILKDRILRKNLA